MKRKILLVDDDPNLLTNLSQFLRFEGYDVKTAESGEQALEKLQLLRPDLIILDMSMPGMGGVGFLEKITDASGKPRHPVLVLTARAQMAEFFASTEVDGFVAKPADPEALLAEVGRILFLRGGERYAEPAPQAETAARRILLADDDRERLAGLSLGLEGAGYEVASTTSGPLALEQLLADKYDLLLVRSDLAELSAAELLKLVRAMPSIRGIPAVIYCDDDCTTAPPDDLTLIVDGSTPEAVLPMLEQVL